MIRTGMVSAKVELGATHSGESAEVNVSDHEYEVGHNKQTDQKYPQEEGFTKKL